VTIEDECPTCLHAIDEALADEADAEAEDDPDADG